MFYNTKERNNFGILVLTLTAILFLAGCSSDDSDNTVQINLKGIWNAYWYDDIATVDHLIIDENTDSGNIKGRWYDAEDDSYYNASGTISDHEISINVQYPFSWDMNASLNADNNTVSGEVTISGTSSALDGVHPLSLQLVD